MQPEAFGELKKRSRQPTYREHAPFSAQWESGIVLKLFCRAKVPEADKGRGRDDPLTIRNERDYL